MNKRIKEIGEKAGLFMERQHPGGFPNEELSVAYKFAELMVKECAGVAEVSMPINSHPDDRLTVKNNVLKHFGVEE